MRLNKAAFSILVGYHKFTKKMFFFFFFFWHYNPWWLLASSTVFLYCPWSCDLTSPIPCTADPCSWWLVFFVSSFRSPQITYFYGVGFSATCPTANLEDQGILFCLGHHLDLSGMVGPTSSYATASIALRIIGPHKPHHYIKVGAPLVGGEGEILKYKILGCVMKLK
jgi:hypothetical protein